MPNQGKKKVLAVLDDLFFRVKIADAAKRVGLDIDFVNKEDDVIERAKEQPLVIIIDLNINSLQPLKLISALKSSPAFELARNEIFPVLMATLVIVGFFAWARWSTHEPR